jgi:hypothetical protein
VAVTPRPPPRLRPYHVSRQARSAGTP